MVSINELSNENVKKKKKGGGDPHCMTPFCQTHILIAYIEYDLYSMNKLTKVVTT